MGGVQASLSLCQSSSHSKRCHMTSRLISIMIFASQRFGADEFETVLKDLKHLASLLWQSTHCRHHFWLTRCAC